MHILGISAFFHDSAAAIVEDGRIVAAAQEERFTRTKHDAGFPRHAIDYCLEEAGVSLAQVDRVVFFEKPFLKFERLLETYVAFAPRGLQSFAKAMPVWVKDKLFQKDQLIKLLQSIDEGFDRTALRFSEHHLSHAASAFYPSPFEEAVVLTVDGVGEWATTTVAVGKGKSLSIEREIHFPHSLGLLYSAFTYYTGFRVNSGEYKVMGLAPYGDPKYADLILDKLIELKPDGSYFLDQSYFNYCTGLTMTNRKFSDLFGRPVRKPDDDPLEQFHMDIAASIQLVVERAMDNLVSTLAREYQTPNLCLAGGVALNCVANGKLLRARHFDNIWIQPAAGDAGGSLGAALAQWHIGEDGQRVINPEDSMAGSYIGPGFDDAEAARRLDAMNAVYEQVSDEQLFADTARAIADGEAVGWFQGRMEFGPRALGGRSILGDPRSPDMQKVLNLKVKYRESFRPFAPSVLRERVSEWFEHDGDSPYMLLVADVAESRRKHMTDEQQLLFGIDKLNVQRSSIPSVTHVDYSARVQTVHEQTNPRYHRLIQTFDELTGVPLLINTSFNIRGEPIVGSPEDAYRCFMGCEIERLVIGNLVLKKSDQPVENKRDYRGDFKLD